jgi:hypothetical protein
MTALMTDKKIIKAGFLKNENRGNISRGSG